MIYRYASQCSKMLLMMLPSLSPDVVVEYSLPTKENVGQYVIDDQRINVELEIDDELVVGHGIA
jgi:hypothetical protein